MSPSRPSDRPGRGRASRLSLLLVPLLASCFNAPYTGVIEVCRGKVAEGLFGKGTDPAKILNTPPNCARAPYLSAAMRVCMQQGGTFEAVGDPTRLLTVPGAPSSMPAQHCEIAGARQGDVSAQAQHAKLTCGQLAGGVVEVVCWESGAGNEKASALFGFGPPEIPLTDPRLDKGDGGL